MYFRQKIKATDRKSMKIEHHQFMNNHERRMPRECFIIYIIRCIRCSSMIYVWSNTITYATPTDTSRAFSFSFHCLATFFPPCFIDGDYYVLFSGSFVTNGELNGKMARDWTFKMDVTKELHLSFVPSWLHPPLTHSLFKWIDREDVMRDLGGSVDLLLHRFPIIRSILWWSGCKFDVESWLRRWETCCARRYMDHDWYVRSSME